ncbi:hypothetical protein NDU88_008232 [Pleurodeles waltl]|uniref:DUF4939 domain-containing protein n=1 Tax=Pleurodeles waltl TaxID=8319 RepID=A0AAV7VRZ0_PLEWA|nr:hypothetical protein NDU88_008232 [Pleurodeles waltl]
MWRKPSIRLAPHNAFSGRGAPRAFSAQREAPDFTWGLALPSVAARSVLGGSIADSTVATRKSRPFLGQSQTFKTHATAVSWRKQHVSRDRLQRPTIPTSSDTMDDTVAAAADPDPALLTTIQQQAQELQQLSNENAVLRQALALRSGDVPTISASTPRFSGEPTKLREFLDALTVYFAFRPTQFSHDRTKVGYLISALSGPALAWATPMVSSNDPVLSDYSAFVTRFKQMFSRPGLEALAEEALCDIQQGSQDVLQYITRFRQLAAETTWVELSSSRTTNGEEKE